MNLLKLLFGKKQKPVNTVINQPKFPGSTATFYYGGSHVAYDHQDDYGTQYAQPPVYPWTEIGDQQPTPEHHTRDFGGYGGGDGGGSYSSND